MEICWLDDALADMTLIYSHIVADDPRAAASVVARIRASVRLLVTAPNRGRPGRWPGTRKLIVSGTRYIVPDRARDGLIEILRVLHSARRWPLEPPDD